VPRAASQQDLGSKPTKEVKHPTVHEYNEAHQSALHHLAGTNNTHALENVLGAVPRL
jgi:hypothetical protein